MGISLKPFRGRRFQRGSQATLSVSAFLGILVLLNVLAVQAPWRLDATANSLYSLSEQTFTVLDDLQDEVTVVAFIREDAMGLQMKDFLKQYGHASGKVSVSFVNPLTTPSAARQRNVEKFNTVVVEGNGRTRMIQPTNLFVASADGNSVEFRGEQPITHAIIQVTSGYSPKVLFLTGHGEPALDGRDLFRLQQNLNGEGYVPESINLGNAGSIPQDAALIMAVGPKKDLLPRERELLTSYLHEGGRLLLMLDPTPGEDLKEWKSLLNPLGIEIHDDVVVDPERGFFMDPMAPSPQTFLHSITKDILKRRLSVVLPLARSFEEIRRRDAEYLVTPVLVTSTAAWGETNLEGGQPVKGKDDLPGPLMLGAAVSRPDPDAPESSSEELRTQVPGDRPESEQHRVAVVVGNSNFIREDALDFPGNLDFIMNSVNWLLGQDKLITTRPKYMELRPANLTPPQAARVFWGTVVVLPLLPALAGVLVWRRRRWL